MSADKQHLEQLSEIRNLMERSSRFISLSGLSGVMAGVFALAGAAMAYYWMESNLAGVRYSDYANDFTGKINPEFLMFFLMDACAVLVLTLISGVILTSRKAKRLGVPTWDKSAERLLVNLMIPLVAGGVFCAILLYHGIFGFIAPATLLFYGMALVNAGKYSVPELRYLGLTEMALGLAACFFIGKGLIFWAIGFGALHILYGSIMHFKYDRQA